MKINRIVGKSEAGYWVRSKIKRPTINRIFLPKNERLS